MTVEKLSVSLDADLVERGREAAEEEGLSFSAWVAQGMKRQLKIRDGIRAMEQWQEEFGPFTEEEIARADERLFGRSRKQASDEPGDYA